MEFRDLKQQYQKYKEEIDQSIFRVLDQARFIGGQEVTQLEDRLKEYVGTKHCITCANGTEAMTLVLLAWGIGKGDAVFVPDFTFFSTGEVVSFVGATPIFVDVDEDTFNIDPEKLEAAIQKVKDEKKLTPKVVMPVDLFGLPADYQRINAIVKRHDLLVLEDSAQGFGGSTGEKKAGSFGDAATTSFFPAKPLGCYGDGGAIFLDDDNTAALIRSLKVHGKGNGKYDNIRIGVNSRLDTLQAAILDVKLTAFIQHELDDVNKAAKWYDESLEGLVKTPYIPEGYVSSYAQYTIQLESKEIRDGLQEHMKNESIPSMIYYQKPMHKQLAFSTLNYKDASFEVTSALCEKVLSLPMHPYLSKKDVGKVTESIKRYLEVEK